jgi:dolichyl-phosphate beta-glucosyltransferase
MFDVEILVMARQRGYRIAQVPVRWRDDGDSRLRLVAGNLRNALDILSISLHHRAQRTALTSEVNGAPSGAQDNRE